MFAKVESREMNQLGREQLETEKLGSASRLISTELSDTQRESRSTN